MSSPVAAKRVRSAQDGPRSREAIRCPAAIFCPFRHTIRHTAPGYRGDARPRSLVLGVGDNRSRRGTIQSPLNFTGVQTGQKWHGFWHTARKPSDFSRDGGAA